MKPHFALAPLLAVVVAAATPAAAQGQETPPAGTEDILSSMDPEWARSFRGIRVFTEPSQDAVMGFPQPMEVREVRVKGGERVKLGDLLVRARDDEPAASAKLYEMRASNELEIRAAEAVLELRETQLQRHELALAQAGGSQLAVDEARAQRDVAAIEVESAKMRLEEAKAQYEQARAVLDRYHLRARFDGVVETVEVDPGQAVSEGQPVVRVVNTDRLRMRVWTPVREAHGLEAGARAWVVMDLPGDPRVFEAEVTEVSPVVDFPSQKRMVRVEVANPEGAPAGLTAWVRFVEPQGEWAERVVVLEEGRGTPPLRGGMPGARPPEGGTNRAESVTDGQAANGVSEERRGVNGSATEWRGAQAGSATEWRGTQAGSAAEWRGTQAGSATEWRGTQASVGREDGR